MLVLLFGLTKPDRKLGCPLYEGKKNNQSYMLRPVTEFCYSMVGVVQACEFVGLTSKPALGMSKIVKLFYNLFLD